MSINLPGLGKKHRVLYYSARTWGCPITSELFLERGLGISKNVSTLLFLHFQWAELSISSVIRWIDRLVSEFSCSTSVCRKLIQRFLSITRGAPELACCTTGPLIFSHLSINFPAFVFCLLPSTPSHTIANNLEPSTLTSRATAFFSVSRLDEVGIFHEVSFFTLRVDEFYTCL